MQIMQAQARCSAASPATCAACSWGAPPQASPQPLSHHNQIIAACRGLVARDVRRPHRPPLQGLLQYYDSLHLSGSHVLKQLGRWLLLDCEDKGVPMPPQPLQYADVTSGGACAWAAPARLRPPASRAAATAAGWSSKRMPTAGVASGQHVDVQLRSMAHKA
jgi:hypothetical protein